VSSLLDVVIVSALALSGTLMESLAWQVVAAVFTAAAVFGLVLDQIKMPVMSAFRMR
jgi:H+-transporting ATPase